MIVPAGRFLEMLVDYARRFFTWWTTELVSLVPSRVSTWLGRPVASVVAVVAPGGIELYRLSEAGVRVRLSDPDRIVLDGARENVSVDNVPLDLVLPTHEALRQLLVLPAGAGRDLRAIVEHEVERHTPFRLGDVYFDARVVDRDDSAGTLSVELAVVRRPTADSAVALARQFGLEPRRLRLDMGNATECFDFLPGAARHERRDWVAVFLGVLAVVLLTSSLATQLVQLDRTSQALADKARLARSDALAAEKIAKEIHVLVKQELFLLRKKEEPPAIKVLRELTQILPDDTWVKELEMTGREVRLQGFSQAAAGVVNAVEQSSLFSGARFRSPVVRDERTAREQFSLTFDIRR